MPLIKGHNIKAMSANIRELMTTKPSPAREKAIRTIMKRRKVTRKEAMMIQAKAIARNQ